MRPFEIVFCLLACLGIAPRFEIEPAVFLLPLVVQLNESLLAEPRDGAAAGQLFAVVVVSSVSAARCLSQQNAGSFISKTAAAAAVRLRFRAQPESNFLNRVETRRTTRTRC
jgi:hypothetical protein